MLSWRSWPSGSTGPDTTCGEPWEWQSTGVPARAVEELAAQLAEAAGAEVELERPSDPAHGDYATNVALRLAPAQQRAPRELAEELAERAAELPQVERAEVAGPGFLNLFVTDAFLAEALTEIGGDYGGGSAEVPERVN